MNFNGTTINDKISLPHKGRYATTNKDILLAAIKRAKPDYDWNEDDYDDDRNFSHHFDAALWHALKDVNIDIDAENVMHDYGNGDITEDVDYLNVDGKQVPCYLLTIAGDWQIPAAVLLYSDPKGKIRMYFPKRGNLFNPKEKRALEPDDDLNDLKPYMEHPEDLDDPDFSLYDDAQIDWDLVEEDCRARLIPVD